MKKELFVEVIHAIKKQHDINREVAKNMGKAFPNAFEANLMPDNSVLEGVLLKVLREAMDDRVDMDGNTWIDWFIYENDFGLRKLTVVNRDGSKFHIANASELYEFLKNR